MAMKRRWPGRRIVGVDIARPYIEHARAHAGTDAPEFKVVEAGHRR
jgi:trans-aconitate methyltransferase